MTSMWGDLFDGHAAEPRRAALAVEAGALVIEPEDGAPLRWQLDDLRRLRDQSDGATVLRLASEPLARLHVSGAAAARIAEAAPRLGGPIPALMRGRWRLIPWGLGAAASIALILTVLLPTAADRLAPLLPPGGEAALGDVTLERVKDLLAPPGSVLPLAECRAPEGLAALDAMTERLTDGAALPHPPRVTVLDHPMVNAFALPGGRVVLMRGLIDEAEHPDEVAAVLAHELGHVAASDPTRAALRSAGSIGVLGLAFGDFAGGALILFLLNASIEASYSREAEVAADDYARDRLIEAGLSPAALGDFFERLAAGAGEAPPILAHLTSHPDLAGRIEAARAEAPPAAGPPSLDGVDWLALQTICP